MRILLGLFAMLVLPLWGAETVATVQIVQGTVTAVRAGSSRVLQQGASVFLNDMINVAADSGVELLYTDKSVVDLAANTVFTIRGYRYSSGGLGNKNSSELSKGAFRFLSGDIKPDPQQYNVKTPNATIGLLGTIFEGQIADDTLYVSCEKGRVQISNSSGSVVIGEGMEQYAIVTSYLRRPQIYISPPTPMIRPMITPHP